MRNHILLFFTAVSAAVSAQTPLPIPPALTGTTFNLTVQNGVTQFFPSINTPTYGINGPLLGPTLIMNRGDWVTLNVTNTLTGNGNSTTMHWHGMHVPAMADGGPHQVIAQNTTWSPTFEVLNRAGTFWYHPHGEGKTDLHVSRGLAGMIIVKDTDEAALALPRTYGVDDFPLVVQTKSFDVLNQIAISTAYDTTHMVNGVIDPYLDAPAQVVRFRLLNGASERTFMFGFSNNMNFHVIGSDGGLLDTAVTVNRLRLSNGERAEILVDLSAMQNDTVFLMSYGSELDHGIMGADSVGDAMHQVPDYYNNFLNGADYNLLQLNVVAPTGSPVTTIPQALVAHSPWPASSATVNRRFELDTLSEVFTTPNLAEGPFGINRHFFDMDSINEVVYLNTTEIWTLHNKTMVAHPFHIHDVEFYILDIGGNPPPPEQAGLKDVVLVPPGDSVRFITRFEDFADDTVPYMYHCHLLHHEDDGMMGSFLVIDSTTSVQEHGPSAAKLACFPNPAAGVLHVSLPGNTSGDGLLLLQDGSGRLLRQLAVKKGSDMAELDMSSLAEGVYAVRFISGTHSYTAKVIVLHR